MAQKEKFSSCEFSKLNRIGPAGGITESDLESSVLTTIHNLDSSAKRSGFRKWFDKNLMLLATLSGVIFGVVEGELYYTNSD